MKKKFVLLIGAFLAVYILPAQITIQGNVTDEEGIALIGANVFEKETTNGTITDFDGNYSLTVNDANAVIVVSYTGYLSLEQAVPASGDLDFVLSEGAILDEIVVVGYGEQDRQSLTGAVTSISAREFETQPIAGIDQLLQGQAPGLIVLGGSGQPGADAGSVMLRGPSTIQGSNAPIYIMDGILDLIE